MGSDNGRQVKENIKESWWIGLTARLQQAANSQNGYALVTITVLVDEHGNPTFWTEPKVSKIEPLRRGKDFLESMLRCMDS